MGKRDGPGVEGLRQLLHEGPVTALVDIRVRDKGIPVLPGGEAVNVGPDAVLSLRVVAVAPAVQQHQHGGVVLRCQELVQLADALHHGLFRLKIPGF